MNSAPWTEIGALQNQVRDIQYKIRDKADSHEIHSINGRLSIIEASINSLSSRLREIEYRMGGLEDKFTIYGQ